MSLIQQFAIRNELLYSGFVLPNVQIFFVQKISFATFGVSIDDFFTRYAGLGYSLILCNIIRNRISGSYSDDICFISNSEKSKLPPNINVNAIHLCSIWYSARQRVSISANILRFSLKAKINGRFNLVVWH